MVDFLETHSCVHKLAHSLIILSDSFVGLNPVYLEAVAPLLEQHATQRLATDLGVI